MAAYAALVSLMHTINQIHHHPLPPISLHEPQIQSLAENVTFLQDFLETYSLTKDQDALEGRIAEAAYAVEDVIESHIVDQILDGESEYPGPIDLLYEGLQRVIQDMDLIKGEVTAGTEIKLIARNALPDGLLRPTSMGKNAMVGFDEVKNQIMDKLTGLETGCQILPIVGMGGIGKTTLARNIYENTIIKNHFIVLAWITISQDYSAKEIVSQVLLCLVDTSVSKESLARMSELELGDMLHKSLFKRRYLIVMDDMWSSKAWENVSCFFPENDNGSRIIITSRLSMVAFEITGSHGLEMTLLDDDKSWELLCVNVDCPAELEGIGRSIVKSCKGLPLSIVVIGGLLAKSKPTREYWQHIAENLSSTVNLADDERCLKILHTSYNELPIHIKPCFLYMGVYPENREINVPYLMKLWVAEGFLKPDTSKSLEKVAEEYLKDLLDRNLVMVSQRKYTWKIKCCVIHNLLMDLCVREAEKHNFLCVTIRNDNISQEIINVQRRIVVHEGTAPEVIDALPSAPLVRSFLYQANRPPRSFGFRLSRVWSGINVRLELACSCLVNCRYLNSLHISDPSLYAYTPLHLLWNLQTIHISRAPRGTVLYDFWKMSRLAHVKFDLLHLPEPHADGENEFVLENLQTLSMVRDFKCGEESVRRIPNIRRLGLYYDEEIEDWPSCGLVNLARLLKLESLSLHFSSRSKPSRSDLLENLAVPSSLKKLTLINTRLQWEDLTTNIGPLPNLEVLKLHVSSFQGPEWETVEDQFCKLKFLQISHCVDLEYWTTDSSHFPLLEHLSLRFLDKLTEIPCGIGEIPTLKSIELDRCSDFVVHSAKEILTEHEDLEEEECLQVRVVIWDNNRDLESLRSPNFQVDIRKWI